MPPTAVVDVELLEDTAVVDVELLEDTAVVDVELLEDEGVESPKVAQLSHTDTDPSTPCFTDKQIVYVVPAFSPL